MNQKKDVMSISKKMQIALSGGLAVGIIFMLIHQNLIKRGMKLHGSRSISFYSGTLLQQTICSIMLM